MAASKNKAVIVRLPLELHKQLKARAERENRSVNNLILTILKRSKE